ncbi:methylenetetrahydrofolate reductase C-terminal domain-containing protein [Thermococcus waiotapuensis]|uniref:Methylenetetrahydrofolate reductase C-terminal domain-containing protein n=1 Tax=Thermococcus waiotapuensis TaxID=90909 RepID=A0AAE4T1J0_9EURY|nr:methylenetetrahydrofolate reductase C-terminal domain-containing protein [Thermococcus waiotapuensis]MDV3103237.1 methylenetetrahydrofolate reductase C-terminal domain-containing protein [Thermococcus waiotapuensis]
MVEIRATTCPRGLLNGPCGGALNGKCDVDGKECPWFSIVERFNVDPSTLFEEHPLLLEMEDLVERDSAPRASAFWRNIERGKAFSVEFPVAAVKGTEDSLEILEMVEADMIAIPDNPLGYPHYDPVAVACYLKSLGLKTGVMPHITAKDRNLSALTSELRTAQVFGCEFVLVTTGDWPGFAIPSRPVFDLDSANLVRLARLVFAGVMPTKEVVEVTSRPRVATTMNPHYGPKVEAKRLARKLIAGGEVFFTQVVASTESVRNIEGTLKELERYADVDVPVVVSLLYPLREEMKPFLKGMRIPVGNESFEELLEELKAVDAVRGINLIVSSREIGEWFGLLEVAREKVKEVFG